MADHDADLRAELEALRRRVTELEQRQPAEPGPPPGEPTEARDRRGFLALAAGTAVAGAAAVVGGATPAAAADSNPVLLGQANFPSTPASVTSIDSPSGADLSPVLFRANNWTTDPVHPNATMRVATYSLTAGPDSAAEPQGFRVGAMGVASRLDDDTDPRGVGVYGAANSTGTVPEPPQPTGVYGVSFGGVTGAVGVGVTGYAACDVGIGVRGVSDDGGIGVLAEVADGVALDARASGTGTGVKAWHFGGGTALSVIGRLHQTASGTIGPPTSGTSSIGEQWRDSAGAMYLCTAAGNPGTWRKVVAQHPAYADAGGSINLLPRPIRVVDTRPTSTAPLKNGGARLAPSTNTTFQITGTTVAGVAVPAGATGVLGNITATGTQGDGFFSVFAAGLPPTGTSTVNYTSTTIANFFLTALSTTGALTVRCGSNASHCIIDITAFLA